MLDSNPVATPITTGTKLLKIGDDDEKADQKLYQSMVGSIRYGMLCTKPDVAFVVQPDIAVPARKLETRLGPLVSIRIEPRF
jgi:hypothetical protein